MKSLPIGLAAGIAALALLAGCDAAGQGNGAAPANEAASAGGGPPPAPAPERPPEPFRLKTRQVIATLRVDANSDVAAFIVMRPVEVVLPNPGIAFAGRFYIVHARAGPVTVSAGGGTIEGSSSMILQRGQSAILLSDGRDSYALINPVSGD